MSELTTKYVSLELTLAQGNLILEGLAERPFKQVFELIGYLNQQARAEFAADSTEESAATFVLSSAQVRLILEALGEMPFNRVHRLLQSMHQQMRAAQQQSRQSAEVSLSDD
ncbi:hypothetical protein [Undibacterium terreum]|uniref:Uncharacterized protein n=1 Tax=Undibacterium terreum TaxID=1224302 RepID=A0A916ULZ2_9BURK|nr:hypothetical protein [Undibacterium terreum]GGC76658.1 hypothetical protein GCM10011396_24860 [Undibacterium terreum]